MIKVIIHTFISVLLFSFGLGLLNNAFAGGSWSSGKVTSLLASGVDPAMRLTGNKSPDNCDGGRYGWLYFAGTAEERNRVYATALAMSLSNKTVTVYTNGDGGKCRIKNIQITSGLGL